ncbi:MAG TPA: type II toxin-antitoxin system prevent-host-death family antitoxin [Variovorax sp.]|nr:type II toxin-antitoxin system prevent-host-death family antitoxin [Variovorax sp.]
MQVSATEAKNRFGYYLSQAEREPVRIMKNDRVAGVIVSAARYEQLEALEQKRSVSQRRREFEDKYKGWIEQQNDLVDRIGIVGEEYRTW